MLPGALAMSIEVLMIDVLLIVSFTHDQRHAAVRLILIGIGI